MPFAIFPLILPLLQQVALFGTSIGLSLAATTALVTAVSYGLQALIVVGLGIGLNYLNQALAPKPKQPKPEDRHNMVREAQQPHWYLFGRGKGGGALVFLSTKNGTLHRVLAMHKGVYDQVEEHWIDAKVVTLDASGNVTTAPFAGYVKIEFRLGNPGQTHYSLLGALFPDFWTADHKGDGIAHAWIENKPISLEKFSDVFPRGEPNYRQVGRGLRCWDPRDNTQSSTDPLTWKWSENSALAILWWLMSNEGFKMNASLFERAAAEWIVAANICDELIPLRLGGNEKRYRTWNWISSAERRADVLSRLMDVCDARMTRTNNGGLTIQVGKWLEPTVTIGDDAIIDYEMQKGSLRINRSKVILGKYTSPLHGYTATDAEPWGDPDDVEAALAGLDDSITPLEFYASPSHAQTRRLMKISASRFDPRYSGQITCNMRGLSMIGERFIRLQITREFSIDETFEINGDPEFVFGENGVLIGIRVTIIAMNAAAWAWDAASEEGEAPPIPSDLEIDNSIPAPTGIVATDLLKTVGAASYAVASISWDAPTNVSLKAEVRIKKKIESDAAWLGVPVLQQQQRAESSPLEDGVIYVIQVRFQAITGRVSDWAPEPAAEVTALADPVAPPAVTAVSATGGVGQVQVNWTSPNSSHYVKARLFRNTVNNFGTATLFTDAYGPASTAQHFIDSGLAAGTYYYWVVAANASNVEAAEVPTGAVTVT